jgi:predicted acyltransferase
VLTGHWLRAKASPLRKTAGLALAGVGCLLVGNLWGIWFPVIKNLWTSSYVVVAGGWSLLLLALFYWIIDVRGWRRWAFFFTVIGVNPITIYVIRSQFDFGIITRIFVRGFIDYFGPARPVVWDFLVMMSGWLLLYCLYRKKIFLRV